MPWTELREARHQRSEPVNMARLEHELALQQAAQAIRRGAIITWFIAGLNTVYVVVALLTSSPELEGARNPWAFVGIAFMGVLGIGIYKKSRFAALTMLVYFGATRTFVHVIHRTPGGFFFTLFFGVLLYKAVRGAYAHNRETRLLAESADNTTTTPIGSATHPQSA